MNICLLLIGYRPPGLHFWIWQLFSGKQVCLLVWNKLYFGKCLLYVRDWEFEIVYEINIINKTYVK
jgi:hypothetical protein